MKEMGGEGLINSLPIDVNIVHSNVRRASAEDEITNLWTDEWLYWFHTNFRFTF